MAERMTFPMYAIHRQQTQALWQAVQSLLAERGVMVAGDPPAADPGDLLAHWRQPTLLLSQTCGYPLVTQLPEVQTVVQHRALGGIGETEIQVQRPP